MQFGEVNRNQLSKINFKLPPDPKSNAAVFAKGNGEQAKIYLGCAKWGRTEWIGKIYPQDAKERDFLKYYGQHYGSIELNATHYKIYDPEHLKAWKAQVNNADFKFCPKAHRGMSYLKDSPTKARLTKDFLKTVRSFGENLGPIFITHDEKIKWDAQAEKEFFAYLETLPGTNTFFIEERWPRFFEDKKLMGRYYDRLRELGIGTVITDTAGRRDVLHMQCTIPKTFIRFVGNSLHPTDFPRIDSWALRLKKWMEQGIEEIYFFMHMHDEGKSPELTQYVVESFNKKAKLYLPPVEFVS